MIRIVKGICLLIIVTACASAQNKPLLSVNNLTGNSSLIDLSRAFNGKIDDVQVVGLGEVSHGDRTTFDFNLKMVQFLITEKRFRILFLEGPDAVFEPLESFIKSRKSYNTGDIEKLISNTIPIGPAHDRETVQLVKWLKDYNVAHPDQLVSLHGASFDQKNPETLLENYVKPYDKASAEAMYVKWKQPGYRPLYRYSDIFNWKITHQDLISKLDNDVKIKLNNDMWETATATIYFYGILNNIAKKKHKFYFSYNGADLPLADDNYYLRLKLNPDYDKRINTNIAMLEFTRDSLMANKVIDLANSSLAIVWCHNDHIANHRYDKEHPYMGAWIKQRLGSKYFSILTDYTMGAKVMSYDNFKPKTEPNALAGKASAKMFRDKYKIFQGLLFSDDLKKNGINDVVLHRIDVFANPSLENFPVSSFDALFLIEQLEPRILLQ